LYKSLLLDLEEFVHPTGPEALTIEAERQNPKKSAPKLGEKEDSHEETTSTEVKSRKPGGIQMERR
jgi:hypothetical protein